MRIGSVDGSSVLNHEGVEYHADESGMFDVPQELGEQLVSFPHFQREHEIRDAAAAARSAAAKDPAALLERVAALEDQVAHLVTALDAATKSMGDVAGKLADWWTFQAQAAAVPPVKAAAKKAAPVEAPA